MNLITLDSDMHLIFPGTIGAESNIEVTKSYRRSLPDPTPTSLIFSSPPQLEAQLTIALRLTSGTGCEKKKKDHTQKKNSLHEYHGKYMMKSRENTLTDKN